MSEKKLWAAQPCILCGTPTTNKNGVCDKDDHPLSEEEHPFSEASPQGVKRQEAEKRAAKMLRGGADDTPRDRECLALLILAHSVARDERHWSVVDVADRAENAAELAEAVNRVLRDQDAAVSRELQGLRGPPEEHGRRRRSMSDAEVRDLERRVLGGDTDALPRLRALYWRLGPPPTNPEIGSMWIERAPRPDSKVKRVIEVKAVGVERGARKDFIEVGLLNERDLIAEMNANFPGLIDQPGRHVVTMFRLSPSGLQKAFRHKRGAE